MEHRRRNTRTRRGRSGGFTLLELILVMVIMTVLAGAVAFSVTGRGTEARIARVKSDLSTYQRAVEAYALEHNDKYPTSLSDLSGGEKEYIQKVKNDPWGQPYVFRVPGKKHPRYDLFSRGPDGLEGTEDDVSVWDIE
jgi:general secretion pathway protein G